MHKPDLQPVILEERCAECNRLVLYGPKAELLQKVCCDCGWIYVELEYKQW